MTSNQRPEPTPSSEAANLLETVREPLTRLARAFARSAEDAEELMGEMSQAILQDFGELGNDGGSNAWVGVAALDTCRIHARRRRLERAAAEELRKHGLPVGGEELGSDVAEMSARLETALAQLDASSAEVLRMSSLGAMSCSAVAGVLEVPSETVEQSIVRARKRLAELIRPEAPDELYAEHTLHAEEQRRALWLAPPSLGTRLLCAGRQLLRSLSRAFSQKT